MATFDLQFGASIGRYHIVRRLGAGGMAEVFLAHDSRLNRDVAVKVLGGELADRPGYRLYLQREARAVARLNHPNIAQVYDVLEYRGRACFVMEYMEGEPLSYLLRRGPLPLQDAVRIGAQVAGAVAHAHAQGVLHCDLKPGNIYITTAGVAKVLDFGLARPLLQEAGAANEIGASPTLVQNRAGTPPYMAPEMYLGAPLDERSDVYSLGIVLLEMATGRPPGTWPIAAGRTPDEPTRELLGEEDVPPLLAPIVRRALAPTPQARYQSALELAAALESIVARARTDNSEARDWAERRTADARWDEGWTERSTGAREGRARVVRAGTVTLGAFASLVLLGLVNSAALNLTLGRAGFVSEGPWDWLQWGVRSVVAPGVLAAAALVGFGVLQSLAQMLWRGPLSQISTGVAAFARRRGLVDSVVAAHALAAGGAVVLAAMYWRFSGLIAAFMSEISFASPEALALLREENVVEHRQYRMAFTMLVVVMSAALWRLFRARRRRPFDGRPLAAAAAVLVLALLLLNLPYRILYQVDRFQVVRLGEQFGYVLGEADGRMLVFWPFGSQPRNRTLRGDDPRVERLNCYGRVFDPPVACEPVR